MIFRPVDTKQIFQGVTPSFQKSSHDSGRNIFDEGTSAQILCSVSAGDEPMTLTWSFHGNNISTDSGIMTNNFGSKASLLMISSVNHGHRGRYTCLAKNKAGTATSTAELRVNG